MLARGKFLKEANTEATRRCTVLYLLFALLFMVLITHQCLCKEKSSVFFSTSSFELFISARPSKEKHILLILLWQLSIY